MVRGAREARCQEAIYYRVEGRLVCRGNAELREGDDLVRGQVIEFDVETDRVTVSGGASVRLAPPEDTAHESADPAQSDVAPDVGASP
jgi:lipopolysaccharide export system protein LptA